MAYSNATLNGSSVSFAHTEHSQSSYENLNTTYDQPSTNPYLYKPVRPTKSRLRPALSTVFLQLPGDHHQTSSPWTKEPRRQASYESFNSNAKEQLLVQELTDNTGFVRNSSPAESLNTAAMHSNPTGTNFNRFSTCFAGSSVISLLDPGMMHVDNEKPTQTAQSMFSNPRSRRPATSDNDSSDGEGLLRGWSTPRIAKAPTLRISSKELPSLPSTIKGNVHYRSASSCSMYRDDSDLTFPDDDSDILHIRAPGRKTHTQPHEPKYRASSAALKRKQMEWKAEGKTKRTARIIEANLKIKLEEPKAKDCNTTLDGLFGIGKEESKAQRCGYAGLGIASDKRTWKATDDYQTLLRDHVRSSLYNLSPRSPRSMKRKFSSQSNSVPRSPTHSPNQRSISSPNLLSSSKSTSTPRRRKEPPAPLDLSSVSAFNIPSQIKIAQRKFIRKSDKRKVEQQTKPQQNNSQGQYDDEHLTEMKTPRARRITLKGILRSILN